MEQIIYVKTQKDLDSIKDDFCGRIEIKNTTEYISVSRVFNNAYIIVSDNATVKYVYDNATVESVSGNATVESVYGNATVESVYGNATVKYVSGNATVESVYGNATIKSVYDNATVKYVYGNATIEYVFGNATIKSVYDNATIKYVFGNATIKSVYDNATIEYVYDNATIEYVYDNATIEYVYDNATVLLMTGLSCICFLYSAKKIIAKGMNMIRQIGDKKIDLDLGLNVNFVQVKKIIENTPTFKMYSNLYPFEYTKTKAILYKAVHKRDGKYFADYNKDYEYKIGEIKEEKNDSSTLDSCSYGIHLAHKRWAYDFGRSWKDLAILECESAIKDIVVSTDCDGKVRSSKIKVLRELPKEEYDA